MRKTGDRLYHHHRRARRVNKKPPQIKGDETDIIRIVHRESDPFAFEVIHVQRGRLAAVLWRVHELELARTRRNKVRRAILVPERMTTDDDGLNPPGDGPRDALKDDRLAEDSAAEDIADLCAMRGATSGCEAGRDENGHDAYGAIRRAPHLLELELLYACFVRRDGRALDTDVVLEDRLCRFDRHLVTGLRGSR